MTDKMFETVELKKLIPILKNKEGRFAICLGKTKESHVLGIDLKKKPKSIWTQAIKEGETRKGTYGPVAADPEDKNTLVFHCEFECTAKAVKKGLTQVIRRDLKLPFKVRLFDPEGAEVFDDEEEADPAEAEDPEATSDPRQEALLVKLMRLAEGAKARVRQDPDNKDIIVALLRRTRELIEGGKLDDGEKGLRRLAGILNAKPQAAAAPAPEASPQEEAKRPEPAALAAWRKALEETIPMVQGALKEGLGEVKEIKALVGKAKAQAAAGEHLAGAAGLTAVREMIAEARKQAEGPPGSAPSTNGKDLGAALIAELDALARRVAQAKQRSPKHVEALDKIDAQIRKNAGSDKHQKAVTDLGKLRAVLDKLADPLTRSGEEMPGPDATGGDEAAAAPGLSPDGEKFDDLAKGWKTARAQLRTDFDRLEKELLAACREAVNLDELRLGVDRARRETLTALDERLVEALLSAATAPIAPRQEAARKHALSIAGEYTQFVNEDDFLSLIDDNPLAPVPMRKNLEAALAEIVRGLA